MFRDRVALARKVLLRCPDNPAQFFGYLVRQAKAPWDQIKPPDSASRRRFARARECTRFPIPRSVPTNGFSYPPPGPLVLHVEAPRTTFVSRHPPPIKLGEQCAGVIRPFVDLPIPLKEIIRPLVRDEPSHVPVRDAQKKPQLMRAFPLKTTAETLFPRRASGSRIQTP